MLNPSNFRYMNKQTLAQSWKKIISDSKKLDVNNKKNFIVVNHGVPIDPDYNILSEPKKVIEHSKPGPRPGILIILCTVIGYVATLNKSI